MASSASSSDSALVLKSNIQFHIVAVQGLASNLMPKRFNLNRRVAKRVVHAACEGDGYGFQSDTDAISESQSAWNQNLKQMGPLYLNDRVTFRVEQRLPWSLPGHSTTIAKSKEYTLNSLLVLQGKQGHEKHIKIPLASDRVGNGDASLVLQVREPTTRFISDQWLIEAERLSRQHESVIDTNLLTVPKS